ncbi:MAG: GTPase HflX, partial [Planctomycetota bacterium]
VGFIRDLPHNLVASFKSTLEETRQADLLLHVADASSPHVFDQISAVYGVLEELGIEAKDTLLVLNKIDSISSPRVLNRVLDRYPNAIPVSAKSNRGIGPLCEAVGDALQREFLDVEVDVNHQDGKLLSYLSAKGKIESREFGNDHVTVRVRMPSAAMGFVHRSARRVMPTRLDLSGTPTSGPATPRVSNPVAPNTSFPNPGDHSANSDVA